MSKGYVKDADNNILYKFDLPNELVPLLMAEQTIVLVTTSVALDAVVVTVMPLSVEEAEEALIAKKARELAVDELIKDGKLSKTKDKYV